MEVNFQENFAVYVKNLIYTAKFMTHGPVCRPACVLAAASLALNLGPLALARRNGDIAFAFLAHNGQWRRNAWLER